MATEERVLCFERNLFEKLSVFQGLSLDVEKYLPVLTAHANVIYLNRSEAEQDKRYKQLIPYALIVCGDNILRYRRGKGGQETRLHGLVISWGWRPYFGGVDKRPLFHRHWI